MLNKIVSAQKENAIAVAGEIIDLCAGCARHSAGPEAGIQKTKPHIG